MISDVSSEFEANGSLSENLKNAIFGKQIDIVAITKNLAEFYIDRGIVDYKIPPFYAFVNGGYFSGFHIIEYGPSDTYPDHDGFNMDVNGGTMTYHAISYGKIILETSADWITAEMHELSPNMYELKIKIETNPDFETRTGQVYVKSEEGEIYYTNTIRQKGNSQRIYLELALDTKAGAAGFKEADIVNVNGRDYSVSYDSAANLCYVDVSKSSGGYGVSTVPEVVVAGTGDVRCATFTYSPEVGEYFYEDPAVDVEPRSVSVSEAPTGIPCYAALTAAPGMDIPNPAHVKFEKSCVAVMSIGFKSDEYGEDFNVLRIDVELDSEGFLSGELTECMYPDDALFDPTYTVPAPVYRNKSNKLTVHNTNGDKEISLILHPQLAKSLKLTVYYSLPSDSDRKEYTYTMEANREIQFSAGRIVKFATLSVNSR